MWSPTDDIVIATMGFLFRRRVRIFKGLSLNFGKSGFTSASVGRRGFTMNFGRKGRRTTIGLPGTGISYQTKLQPYETHAASPHPSQPPEPVQADAEPGPMWPAPPSTTIPWWAIALGIAVVLGIVSLFR